MTGGFQEATQNDLQRLIPIVIGLIVLWLGIALKSIRGIFLAFSVVICTLVGAFSLLGWLNFPMTSMSGILPQIVIAIGVADAVHAAAAEESHVRALPARRDAPPRARPVHPRHAQDPG